MSGGHSHGSGAYDNRDAVRAVIVSAVALGIASASEFAASIASGSAGVLADALHNAGDVLTTFILLGSFALARRPATRRFTSGFGRIEDIATLLIVLVIVATAAIAAIGSVSRLLHPQAYGNVGFALAAAVVGVVANLSVSEYKVRVGRGLNSTALEADGIHSRIDALVSAGAFAGIGLAALGLPLADPVAGLLITGAILFVLAGTVRDLFYRLMDAIDPALVAEIEGLAGGVDGVLGVTDVRARWVGRELAVVLHISCDPTSRLDQAHAVARQVELELSHHLPAARIDIHMDPGSAPHEHGSHRH